MTLDCPLDLRMPPFLWRTFWRTKRLRTADVVAQSQGRL